MTSNKRFDEIVEQYGHKYGVRIDLYKGAAVLQTSSQDKIWLEAPSDSPLVLFHVNVLSRVSAKSNLREMEAALKKNGNSGDMQGAWLCIHEQSDTLRLCTSVMKKHVDIELLDNCISNIANVYERLTTT